ncbi:MAG: elongation factor G [Hyphomicrobiaceae bacterium]
MGGDSDGPRAEGRVATGKAHARRCVALVGPFLSGKTTLLESILARTGQLQRHGRVADGTSLGDSSPEARAHTMGVELNVVDTTFLDDPFTFIDCPGSVEFQHEALGALSVCDAAVVVCEPDAKRVAALQVILKALEDRAIPHFLFLNKIDTFDTQVRDILPMLQPASRRPLVLRQIPIWENGIATGFVDLALERAFVYREHAASEVIEMPAGILDREKEARFHMLEQLADYDDALMEQLLSDIPPPRDRVFDDLSSELRDGLICPVLLGSAEHGNGILRLLKALRHEVPHVEEAAARLGLGEATVAGRVVKTLHTPHGGKLSVTRVLKGGLADGATVATPGGDERIAGIFALKGGEMEKRSEAKAGDTVALGRLEKAATGDMIAGQRARPAEAEPLAFPDPVYAIAIGLKDRKDEVKLSAALAKLCEEDPGLRHEHNAETHQVLLHGQGEMHLRVATERLQRKYGVAIERLKRALPYKETIRRPAEGIRGRHKKQSGGHGQFGDVVINVAPVARGDGFQFDEKVVGGAVPRQFIPSVEHGVVDYMKNGPLGFPVVDIAVTLMDGSYHTVDSSDMAFRQAARIAMQEAMEKCDPVLLEPVMSVDIAIPSDATPRANAIIAQRRGQILGFDARPEWTGWDVVSARIPAAEMDDLIIEIRSATAGVGTFTARFDHLAEITGRLAEQVLAAQRQAAE